MSLSYTTGNPNNLTAGATASMNDIQGPFTDIKTFLTDGSNAIGYPLLASTVDADYRTIRQEPGTITGSVASSTWVPFAGTLLLPGTDKVPFGAIYLDSSLYPSGTRTGKLRVTLTVFTNNTAPGITFQASLYPMNAPSGGAGAITATLGAAVAGSSASVVTPAATSSNHVETADFNFPSTGYYVVGIATSNTTAANSQTAFTVGLQFRKV